MDAMVLHKIEKKTTNIIFFKGDRVISFFQRVFGILLMLALTRDHICHKHHKQRLCKIKSSLCGCVLGPIEVI